MRIILILSFCIVLISGCSFDEQPTYNFTPTNASADISGFITQSFKAPGTLNISNTEQSVQTICSTVTTINGQRFALGIFLFFLDKKEKTGTFKFTDKTGSSSDYAVASFEIGSGDNRQIFIADSGEVEITAITSNVVTGKFYFTSKDKNSSAVITAKNGVLSFGI